MNNGKTSAKVKRGMSSKKVRNGTKNSKDHIGKKIRNKVNLFSVRAGKQYSVFVYYTCFGVHWFGYAIFLQLCLCIP